MSRPTFIESDRLVLRPVENDDVSFLQEGVNHPDVRRYIGVFDRPYSEETYREEFLPIDTGKDGITLLVVPNTGSFADEPVGSVQLYPILGTDGVGNFGLWFHPDAWGNGYATDASAHLFEFCFRERRLNRISASAMTPNEASRRLLDRLGFVHEGTMRERHFVDGEYVDMELYGLLAAEWEGPENVLKSTEN